METGPSVYTLLMNTVYLPYSTQVAKGTVLRKHGINNIHVFPSNKNFAI